VVTLGLAGLVFVMFLAGVVSEPRAFGNAVLLGLALALGALGLAERLAETPGRAGHLLLLALLLGVALVPFVIGCYLLLNGITMIRRESLRPANLLSMLAGAAIFVVIGLDVVAARAEDVKLSLFATIANLAFGYVSFLLVSYVGYAIVYGLVARTGRADFVVVLGSGLSPGGEVPPLLASRLDRGHEIWSALNRRARGAGPLLIVSGGKGDDEQVPEAHAMASYLTARGFPADHLLLEDRSRNTEENLLFSKTIMDQVKPGARCTVVTSDFHAFRAALLARRVGVRGQVTGARVAGYYRPSAMLREFAAVFLRYWVVNLAICAVLVCVPLGYAAFHHVLPVLHG
jgi:uncharacterized SAM-binding protein YcdF (DUF218 family)